MDKQQEGKPELDRQTVVADMNVAGMPWHRERKHPAPNPNVPPLTKGQTAKVTLSVLAAALLIAGVFIGAGALFILFATNFWLK